MQYIECPKLEPFKHISVFLAGGITGCPDWQSELVDLLRHEDITILNPRRKNFTLDDIDALREQIYWEHLMLRQADLISFWFPKETLCPITLYELGSWTVTSKPIVIGTHPEYKRKHDVEIQTRLVRGCNTKISNSLEDLSYDILDNLEFEFEGI